MEVSSGREARGVSCARYAIPSNQISRLQAMIRRRAVDRIRNYYDAIKAMRHVFYLLCDDVFQPSTRPVDVAIVQVGQNAL
jgi:hypothetical protein